MNTFKFTLPSLLLILTLALSIWLVSCTADTSDPEDGPQGVPGSNCTTEDTANGAIITCEDGSESIINDGDDLTPTPTPVPTPSPEPGKCIKLKKKTICWIVK